MPDSGPLLRRRLRALWHDERSTRVTPLLGVLVVLAVLWLASR